MKNKKIVISIMVIILIVILWLTGIIPKQIGKFYGIYYMNKNFPEWKLDYVNIEWDKYFGDYSISFIDKYGNVRGCLIGPKYFPVFMGQGIFAMQDEYDNKNSE